jgi:divalent metal cation (Fe/Co/Zn/Cd) transporter
MNGTIVLTAVQEDGTSLLVKDSICRVETTLSFVPPPTDTLYDKSNVKEGPKPLSPLYIALIAVAGVSVLFAAIFLARRRVGRKSRSAVVMSS